MRVFLLVFAGISLIACDTIQIPLNTPSSDTDSQTDDTQFSDQGEAENVESIVILETDTQANTTRISSDQRKEVTDFSEALVGTWKKLGSTENEKFIFYPQTDEIGNTVPNMGTFIWRGPHWNGDYEINDINGNWDLNGRELLLTGFIKNTSDENTQFSRTPSKHISTIAIIENYNKNNDLYFDVFERLSGTEKNFNGDWHLSRGIQIKDKLYEKWLTVAIRNNAYFNVAIEDLVVDSNSNTSKFSPSWGSEMAFLADEEVAFFWIENNIVQSWRFPFETTPYEGKQIAFGVKITSDLVAAFRGSQEELLQTTFRKVEGEGPIL